MDCIPPLLPENKDAWKIYNLCRGQMIVSIGGAVDIKHSAVWEAIDRYEIQKPIKTFEKVIQVAASMISYTREEYEKKREETKPGGR